MYIYINKQKSDSDTQSVGSRKLVVRKKKGTENAVSNASQESTWSNQTNKKSSSNAPENMITQKNRDPSRSSLTQTPLSINQMDTFSGGSNAMNAKSSGRRNVRHPVSYAEPALNSKLRRGHEFFPKKEVAIESKNEESKQTDGYEDILKDLASSSVIHNVT